MSGERWVLSQEMFLDEAEVATLQEYLTSASRQADTEATRSEAATNELVMTGLIFSGLRNSEFCQLQLRDTVLGTGQSVFIVREKKGESRTVFVPEFLSAMIRRYATDIRPLRVADGIDPADPTRELLVNERGRPYERTGLYRRVVKILTAAGFGERASVQLLRHTYGYLGYKRSGGNLLFLQKQMGHVHPMVTSVYAEFITEDYAQLADIVGGNRSQSVSVSS